MARNSDLIERLKARAKGLQTEISAVLIAFSDPRTPLRAKIILGLVLAYAFSPIDLIPDFIPALGYLDDLLIIPAGINLALKLIPEEVMHDAREKTRITHEGKDRLGWMGAILIVAIWITLAGLMFILVSRLLRSTT